MPDTYMSRSIARDSELNDIDEQIRKLMQEPDGPHAFKTMMLIMQQMNRNLAENTHATSRIAVATQQQASALETHVKSFDAWRNRGLGAWKIGVTLIGILQAVITFGVMSHIKADEVEAEQLRQTVYKMGVIESRVNGLDAQQGWITNQIINTLREGKPSR